jgi:hypothetical protein
LTVLGGYLNIFFFGRLRVKQNQVIFVCILATLNSAVWSFLGLIAGTKVGNGFLLYFIFNNFRNWHYWSINLNILIRSMCRLLNFSVFRWIL